MRVQWLIVLIFLFHGSSNADTLGAKLGLQIWQSDVEGYVGEADDATIDWQDTNGTNLRLYVNFEHPLLFLPNIKMAYSKFDFGQQTVLTQTYRLGGQLYSIGSELAVDGEYEIFDLISYYEILDRDILSLDVGVNFRMQDTEFQVSGLNSGVSSSADVSEIAPMAYAKLSSSLPLMGLSSYVEIQAGDRNHDYEAAIGYQFIESPLMDVGLFIGLKDQRVNYQFVDGVVGNAQWQSVFVSFEAQL